MQYLEPEHTAFHQGCQLAVNEVHSGNNDSSMCSDPEKEKEAQDAKRLEEVEDLEDALDALCDSGHKFLGRYTILSNVERRGGGQGIVQFAQMVGSAELVAIKFFNRTEVRFQFKISNLNFNASVQRAGHRRRMWLLRITLP